MKLSLLVVAFSALALNAYAQPHRSHRLAARTAEELRSPVEGQFLPIRRVILYSNGVAYIERRGMISGSAEVNLSFKQSQVDDVLKSLVVLDLGKGTIGAVSYNSSAPPSARMADISLLNFRGKFRCARRRARRRSQPTTRSASQRPHLGGPRHDWLSAHSRATQIADRR
ncbi:MAG: hypothetical protein WKF84_14730 [Pyrinomonadaceae bacterium]